MAPRERPTDVDAGPSGLSFQIINGQAVNRVVYNHNLRGVEKVSSSGHPWPPSKRRLRADPLADLGGSFEVLRRTIKDSKTFVQAAHWYGSPSNPASYQYNGRRFARTMNTVYGNNDLPGTIFPSKLLAKGAEGWSRYKPTASQMSGGQALGELRDIRGLISVPRLLSLKRKAWDFRQLAKDAGSDYLHAVFGWVPFLRDVQATCEVVPRTERIIRQLLRDNGKWVHRRGPIDREVGWSPIVTEKGYFSLPSLASYLYNGVETRITQAQAVETYWFSGSFRYYLDTHGSRPELTPGLRRQLMRIVYGVSLDAELLWQLTPWSWLVDWCSSAGAVIDNLSHDTADRLTARYAYVMGSKSLQTTYRVLSSYKGYGYSETSQTYIDEVKTRLKASPFGFGIYPPDFSPQQIAILVALGLSRV